MTVLAHTVSDKKIFKIVSFSRHGKREFLKEFKSLKYSEVHHLLDHFCEGSLKSDSWLQRRRFFSYCLQTNRQTGDIDRSQ